MGCITSTKKLNETRHGNENVFRVRVVRLLAGSPTIHTGYLELTPRELIFYAPGQEPVVWALQHLRRYGLSEDLFSFEAGRRCMSGPGIFTFRCQEADSMYLLFQRYINAVNTDAFVTGADRERLNSAHAVNMRGDGFPHGNNYLEPAPLSGGSGGGGSISGSGMRANFNDTQSTPISPAELDSPDSLPSLSGFHNDMLSTAQQLNNQSQSQSPRTPANAYVNTNLYFDQPLRALQEHNNNNAASSSTTGGGGGCSTGNSSAFSTMTRRTLLRGCSLDVPPFESAPHAEPLHMYANVDTPGACSLRERLTFGSAERCYENVNRSDLPILLQPPPRRELSQQSVISSHHHQYQQQHTQPATPTSASSICCAVTPGVVNYIVLDLDQPRSPTQSSPKSKGGGFGSGLSLTQSIAERKLATAAATSSTVIPSAMSASALASGDTPTLTVSTPTTTTTTPTATLEQHKSETSLGYSTIDFIKTWALIKSTTHGSDFDSNHRTLDNDELRLTRHSKCVRKSYSISE